MEEHSGEPASESCFTDRAWVAAHLHRDDIDSVSLAEVIGAGGLASQIRRLTLKTTSGGEENYILKFIPSESTKRSSDLGMAREAFFYNRFADRLGDIVPTVPFAFGDMKSGEKVILMDDLTSYTQSGYYFGNCSPHNWSKKLDVLTGVPEDSDARRALTRRVTIHAFTIAAKLHSRFWLQKSLLDHSWLRASLWMKSQGKEQWLQSHETAVTSWNNTLEKIKSGESGVKWDPHLLSCMEASFKKISWEDYQREVQSPEYNFTLVHGDFHPANMMWKGSSDSKDVVEDSLILLDWEAVGVGSGAQDIAQYVISHMYPAERRMWEDDLIRMYHTTLLEGGVTRDYTLEQCKKEYITGGVSRWVWFLGLLSGMCPDNMVQFFHDQVAAFMHDHGITPENIAMPRV